MNIKEITELIEIVNYFNSIAEESDKLACDAKILLAVTTTGYYTVVDFGTIVLWCSENDEREYDEKNDKYEEWIPFFKRRLQEISSYIDLFKKIK